MLFNSYEFIFVFLPIAVLLFFVIGKTSRALALTWVVVASISFYAWWRPLNVVIIGPSLLLNFAIGRYLLRTADDAARAASRRWVLALGIAWNVLFLGYFKYVMVVQLSLNELAGTDFVIHNVVLPLGISFITFQKIAFLVDVYGRRIDSFTFKEFCLFIAFFPQLIAGPIVHFRETMPQFRASSCRFNVDDLAVGLTIFSFGLFKKVVLADGIAAHVTPVYEAAAASDVAFLQAWLAAVGFTLQIYFDFSAYSDMATGSARVFGVRLPINFNSPLKATNVIDFWARWHISLTRFLTAYVYSPISLRSVRRRLAGGRTALRGSNYSLGSFVNSLAMPTIVTMFISGVWHGTGLMFVLWGLSHGFYLTVNHAWRAYVAPLWEERERYERRMRPIGFIVTFLAVAVAMVLFRSPSMDVASSIFAGMIGLNGISLPEALVVRLPLPETVAAGIAVDVQSVRAFLFANLWTLTLLALAWCAPNAMQLMAGHDPVLDAERVLDERTGWARALVWKPNVLWSLVVAALVVVSMLQLAGPSEFLYWQF